MTKRNRPLEVVCEKCGSVNKLYSTGSAATYIGVTAGTILAYAEAKQLPKKIVNKGYIFTETELRAAMQRLNLDRSELEVTRV